MTAGLRRQLTGTFDLAIPRTEAFRLFTPDGERSWVPGWDPRFPDRSGDSTDPGSVFETRVHGEQTTWIVVNRKPGRMMSYARVTPGARAGTVSVTVDDAERPGHCSVTVTYDLTALTPAAKTALEEFADDYPVFLRSWKDAIANRALQGETPVAQPPCQR